MNSVNSQNTVIPVVKMVVLVLGVFITGLVSGIVLFGPQRNVDILGNQDEVLDLENQHVWYNRLGWAEAAISVVNIGQKNVILQKVAVRGLECQWSNVYCWKTSTGPISDLLEPTTVELSGYSFTITIDGVNRTLEQVSGELILHSGETVVMYIGNLSNIALDDVGKRVTVAIFTEDKLHYEETVVEKAPITSMGGTILNVENIYWNISASITTITVRNIGTSDATIVDLYVGTTTLSLAGVTQYTDLGDGKYLPRDQKVTIVLSWPNALATSWISGERYYFKVSPEQGSPIEFDARAP